MRLTMQVLLLVGLLIYWAEDSHASWWGRRRRIGSSSGSSSSGGTTTYHYDISTQAGLTRLYNARVTQAERWMRPLASSGGVNPTVARILGLKHSGVVVTVEGGQRFLVHKGDEYGRSTQTIVVKAEHMQSWWRTEIKSISNSRVTDYVQAGGATYSLYTDNCHHASRRMMNLN